jgi:hypothetical protein
VTLAAAPAMAHMQRPAPITLAMPGQATADARLWQVQAQGGEAGEAGLAEATPEAAVLTELMIVEGHMLAARDLYAKGQKDLAVELSRHPGEEGKLDTLGKEIDPKLAGDMTAAITAFSETMAKGASEGEVDQSLTNLTQVFNGIAAGHGQNVRARFDAVTLLLKAAAGEYEGSLKDGAVEDVMAWHEARSFVTLAREALQDLAAMPKWTAAANKSLAATREADAAFGDPMAETPLAGDPQILLGVAARLELISSSVR